MIEIERVYRLEIRVAVTKYSIELAGAAFDGVLKHVVAQYAQ